MECCKNELDFKEVGGIQYKISVAQCPSCKSEFHKKAGSNVAYKKGDSFTCTECGGEIMVGVVAHSVRDGHFPLSGSGQVKNEHVPYCVKCEEKPAFHGSDV